jgi:tRNA pseudouridine13 synthase
MKIKQHHKDFRVRELLGEGFLESKGEHRVYRVTKQRLTTIEAVQRLADMAGVAPSDVSLAGLKDRQGVTTQHMSVRHGKTVDLSDSDLRIETIGGSNRPVSSDVSLGNAFEITVRGLSGEDLEVLRGNVPLVREHGLINYFDEQRFGNVRHGQGWIARDLMSGQTERALKKLLSSISPYEDPKSLSFKKAIEKHWGDWVACREDAGRYGKHHSVFEHLKREPQDFAGAFFHVSSRLRLIHLFAWQSHVWNRAVAAYITERTPEDQRITMSGPEGPLIHPSRPIELESTMKGAFRLPGPGLRDVVHPDQRTCLEDVLAQQRMVASDFDIVGVPGFQLKGEDRPLLLLPKHLRVRPSSRDSLNPSARGLAMVKIRFELPRGAYATLVVRRLFSTTRTSPSLREERTRPQKRTGSDDRGRGPGRGGSKWDRPRRAPKSDPGAERRRRGRAL